MVQYMDNGFNQWANTQSAKKPSRFSGFLLWLGLFFLAWWLMGLWLKPNNIQSNVQNTFNIEKTIVASRNISNDEISADVSGLRISNIVLKQHLNDAKTKENVSLLSNENNFIEVGFVSSDAKTPNVNTNWNLKSGTMYYGTNVSFARNITLDGYVIKVSDVIKNNSGQEINISPYVRIVQSGNDKASGVVESGGVVYANSKLEYANWNKLNKKSYAYSSVRGSLGFANQYWETIASVDANDQTISVKKSGDYYVADTSVAAIKIPAHEQKEINTYVFSGPRETTAVNAAENNIPGISKTIDYGWFWFFAQPMLWMINWLFALVGNYGVAIILMTLILRILIWPLTRKSFASTMAMQKMQPELQRVQKLYANDKARLQMEMMKVYQTHKTSPMSGCLPMLIQIPIFFALYKALLISVPMRSARFLWISDLAAMDPYFILPILMGATMWLQQYLQSVKPQSGVNDAMASTQRAMKWMPVLFTVMFAWMPSGLVLYWTISNLFGILQMYIIKKTNK
nr:membrane protein insertase YidC [Candidatus Enterousia merdequi]